MFALRFGGSFPKVFGKILLMSDLLFLKKFSGPNFCFRVSVLFLCFLVGFCLGFCFTLWRFVPESVRKNSLDVRSAVFEKIFGTELLF